MRQFRRSRWFRAAAVTVLAAFALQLVQVPRDMLLPFVIAFTVVAGGLAALGVFLTRVQVQDRLGRLAPPWLAERLEVFRLEPFRKRLAEGGLMLLNVAALAFLVAVGSVRMVDVKAAPSGGGAVPAQSILYGARLESLRVLAGARVLFDSGSPGNVNPKQMLQGETGTEVAVESSVTGTVYLARTATEVLSGAQVTVSVPRLGYEVPLVETSPGAYQATLSDKMSVSLPDATLGEVAGWRAVPLEMRFNGRAVSSLGLTGLLAGSVAAAEIFTPSGTPVSYEVPFDVSLRAQLLDASGNPVGNRTVSASVYLPNHGYGETLAITTDAEGVFTFQRREIAVISVNGGHLATLAEPIQAPGFDAPGAAALVAFWWGDGGGDPWWSRQVLDRNLNPPDPNNPASVGEPINVTTGNLFHEETDLHLPGRGLNLSFRRTYNSQSQSQGPLGYGWDHNYHSYLEVSSDGKTVKKVGGEGGTVTFTRGFLGTYTPQKGNHQKLIKNPNGTYVVRETNGKEYVYGTDRNLAAIRDPNGNALTLTYANGRPVRVTDPYGRGFLLSYDSQGRVARLEDPGGRAVTYGYDGDGNLAQVTDPGGEVRQYSYDSDHNLTRITGPRGEEASFSYDGNDRATSSSLAGGNGKVTLTYDKDNKKTTVKDSLGYETVYHYQFRHEVGLITKIADPLGYTQEFSWDDDLNRVLVKDRAGRRSRMTYDGRGNLTSFTDAVGNVTRYYYEPRFSRVIRVTDPLGYDTTFAYDTRGNLVKATDALGNAVTVEHDAQGRVTRAVDAAGNALTMEYDAYGNVSRVTDPGGGTTALTYDEAGNLVAFTDASGRAYGFEYDVEGRLVAATDPLGGVTRLEYDSAGNRTRVTDPAGNATSYGYDAVNRLTAVTDPTGRRFSFTYDTEGNPTAFSDALGRRTRFEYDALKRLTRTVLPDGGAAGYRYDAAGNLTEVVNPAGQVTRYEYDALNRLTAVVDALGGVTRYEYDAGDHLTAVVDARGNATRYAYDPLGRLTHVTDANLNPVRFSYDAAGRLTAKEEPNGQRTGYSYDAAGRLAAVAYADGSRVSFAYDPAGNLTEMTDAFGASRFRHDALDRLVAEVRPDGLRVAYEYDAAGNLAAVTDPFGGRTRYAYDPAGRVTETIDAAGGRTAFRYDAGGRLAEMALPNGATVRFGYDTLDRVTAVDNADKNGRVFAGFRYTYDRAGNRTGVTDHKGRVTQYGYDALNRLTEVLYPNGRRVTYAYDAVGNRVSATETPGVEGDDSGGPDGDTGDGDPPQAPGRPRVTDYRYDAANRMVRAGDRLYGYDASGNLIEVRKAGQAGEEEKDATRFEYDGAGRLVRVLKDGKEVARYGYDGLGRRVEVREKEKLTRYVFADDLNPLAELAGKAGKDDEKGKDGLGKSDGKGDKSARSAGGGEEKGAPAWKDKERAPWQDAYVYSLLNGLRLARFRVPGDGKAPKDPLYYHYDALGSVVAASDRSGEAAGFLRYDAWGRPQVQGHLEKQPYAFTGKPWDRDTDLYYFGARYYDPQAGRFISKDPFAGLLELPATQNPYPYVLNNPATYVDPDGRFVWGILLGLYAVYELASTAYDVYSTYDVLTDPCASQADQALVTGALIVSLYSPGGGYTKAARLAANARKGRLAEQLLENQYGWARNWTKFAVNGRNRIPDFVIRDQAGNIQKFVEVKNVANLSYTQQLRDMVDIARARGVPIEIHVRSDTVISDSLMQEVARGGVTIVRHLFPQ